MELLLGPERPITLPRAAGGMVDMTGRYVVGVEGFPGEELRLSEGWCLTGQEPRCSISLPTAIAERVLRTFIKDWNIVGTTEGGLEEFGFIAGWFRRMRDVLKRDVPVLDYSQGEQTAAYPPYLDSTLYAAIKRPEGRVHQLFYTLDDPALALCAANNLTVVPADKVASTGSYVMRAVHPGNVRKPKRAERALR